MMMSILLTGGVAYTGSNVAMLLTNKSHPVIEIVRISDSKIKLFLVKKDERYISALTNMNLSNKVYKIFGKVTLETTWKILL
jgi:UDP-glucose 4-epimerase